MPLRDFIRDRFDRDFIELARMLEDFRRTELLERLFDDLEEDLRMGLDLRIDFRREDFRREDIEREDLDLDPLRLDFTRLSLSFKRLNFFLLPDFLAALLRALILLIFDFFFLSL